MEKTIDQAIRACVHETGVTLEFRAGGEHFAFVADHAVARAAAESVLLQLNEAQRQHAQGRGSGKVVPIRPGCAPFKAG